MKRHGIRSSGLLITATVVRTLIENLVSLLGEASWMITGSIASQIWAYYLTGNTIFCRPTDNINVVGVDIMDRIERAYGVLSSGFSGDERREINFFVSYRPRFRMNVISYSSPQYIDGFSRIRVVRIWKVDVPVASMEDLIIRKLMMGRMEDGIDIINMLRAYRRYLRASIVKEADPEDVFRFSRLIKIAEEEYPDMLDELENKFFEVTKLKVDELSASEGDVRRLVKTLAV